jgi:hypothetical protein
MKTPETDQEWIDFLWSTDGTSYTAAASTIGRTHGTMTKWAAVCGFRKRAGCHSGRFLRGPCASCHIPCDTQDLSPEDRRCAGCIAVAEVNGSAAQELAVIHGIDLAAERRAHRKRMREREAGLRKRLPEPVVFAWPGGDRMGMRMPGMERGAVL